jgi:hypothetical protein
LLPKDPNTLFDGEPLWAAWLPEDLAGEKPRLNPERPETFEVVNPLASTPEVQSIKARTQTAHVDLMLCPFTVCIAVRF